MVQQLSRREGGIRIGGGGSRCTSGGAAATAVSSPPCGRHRYSGSCARLGSGAVARGRGRSAAAVAGRREPRRGENWPPAASTKAPALLANSERALSPGAAAAVQLATPAAVRAEAQRALEEENERLRRLLIVRDAELAALMAERVVAETLRAGFRDFSPSPEAPPPAASSPSTPPVELSSANALRAGFRDFSLSPEAALAATTTSASISPAEKWSSAEAPPVATSSTSTLPPGKPSPSSFEGDNDGLIDSCSERTIPVGDANASMDSELTVPVARFSADEHDANVEASSEDWTALDATELVQHRPSPLLPPPVACSDGDLEAEPLNVTWRRPLVAQNVDFSDRPPTYCCSSVNASASRRGSECRGQDAPCLLAAGTPLEALAAAPAPAPAPALAPAPAPAPAPALALAASPAQVTPAALPAQSQARRIKVPVAVPVAVSVSVRSRAAWEPLAPAASPTSPARSQGASLASQGAPALRPPRLRPSARSHSMPSGVRATGAAGGASPSARQQLSHAQAPPLLSRVRSTSWIRPSAPQSAHDVEAPAAAIMRPASLARPLPPSSHDFVGDGGSDALRSSGAPGIINASRETLFTPRSFVLPLRSPLAPPTAAKFSGESALRPTAWPNVSTSCAGSQSVAPIAVGSAAALASPCGVASRY